MREWTPIPRHVGLYSYETTKGTRYGVRRGYINDLGEKTEFTKSGFISWHEADRVLKKFEAALSESSPRSSLSGMKLGDYFDRMSERKIKYGTWRQSSYDAHTRYFNNHIRPVFGSRRMSEITRSEYQRFLDSLDDDKGLRLGTIKTIHRIMMETLNAAETEDLLDKNRLRKMSIHGKEPKSVDISPADFERWISTAELVLDKYSLALIYTATLGMRRGEVLGLRTSSISFQQDQVNNQEIASIQIDLQRGEDYKLGGPIKTSSSYRTIWASGKVVDYLHFAILASDNLRKKNGVPSDKTPWLWVNRFGDPASSGYLFERMKIVNKATGLQIRPHMLRHYFATQAIAGNAAQIEVMHYLGHKNVQMTADYTRETKQASLDVFKNFDQRVNGDASGQNGEK